MTQEQVKRILTGIMTIQTLLFIVIALLAGILITGCGIDPDDFSAKKSDGCPSSGCVPEVEQPGEEGSQEPREPATEEHTEASNTDTSDKQDSIGCAEGKLCELMSKAEVLEIVGEPDQISGGRWTWKETNLTADKCVPPYHAEYEYAIDCVLLFNRWGELGLSYRFSAEYMDPLGW